MKTFSQTRQAYGATADQLIRSLEAADAGANTTRATRGRWMLPALQLLTAGAVAVARRLELANR